MGDMDVSRKLKEEDDLNVRDDNGDNSDAHHEQQVTEIDAPQVSTKLLQKFKKDCIKAVHPSWKRGERIDRDVLAHINKARLMTTGDKLPKLSAQPPYVQLRQLLVKKSDDIPAALAEAVRVMGDGHKFTQMLYATMIAAGWHPDWICDPKKTTAARKLKSDGVNSAEQVYRRLGIDRDLIERAADSIDLRQNLAGVLYEDKDDLHDLIRLTTEDVISRNFADLRSLVDGQESQQRRNKEVDDRRDRLDDHLDRLEGRLNRLQTITLNVENVVVNAAANQNLIEPNSRQRMEAMESNIARILNHLEALSTQQPLPRARPAQQPSFPQSTQQPLSRARPAWRTQQKSVPPSPQQLPPRIYSAQPIRSGRSRHLARPGQVAQRAQSAQFAHSTQAVQPAQFAQTHQPAQSDQLAQQPSSPAPSTGVQPSAFPADSCDVDEYPPAYMANPDVSCNDEDNAEEYYDYRDDTHEGRHQDHHQDHRQDYSQGYPQGYPQDYNGGYQ